MLRRPEKNRSLVTFTSSRLNNRVPGQARQKVSGQARNDVRPF